jgi:hypothetical protein
MRGSALCIFHARPQPPSAQLERKAAEAIVRQTIQARAEHSPFPRKMPAIQTILLTMLLADVIVVTSAPPLFFI